MRTWLAGRSLCARNQWKHHPLTTRAPAVNCRAVKRPTSRAPVTKPKLMLKSRAPAVNRRAVKRPTSRAPVAKPKLMLKGMGLMGKRRGPAVNGPAVKRLPRSPVERGGGWGGGGLYTILPSPILYGVRHTKGGSARGRILRNGRAIVLQ